MKAMLLHQPCDLAANPTPLTLAQVPVPTPGAADVLIHVSVCGVCHTELDEIEGRTPPARFPRILGHQVVGRVAACGAAVPDLQPGQRVGVAWIYAACGHCEFCVSGRENLCPQFRATGRDADGGYAEFMVAPAAFVYPLPGPQADIHLAPLLCAGAIGYRSLRLTGLQNGQRLGFFGFGASAHLLLRLLKAVYPATEVYVFTRNEAEQAFAKALGAAWAGSILATPPQRLHAAIDSTPAWQPVLAALRVLVPGGRLVINAIRKEAQDRELLAQLDYPTQLWQEKEIKSVANVTRSDVRAFLDVAARINLRPDVTCIPLEEANQALLSLRRGSIRGATVLRINPS
jgi:propanol-preferring alcohol dehydrogenase